MHLHCTGLQRKLLCLPLQGHISLNSIAIKNEQVSPGHTGILFCRANEHRLRGLGSYCSALSGLNTTSTCGHMLTYMRQCGCSCPLHTRLHNLANLQVPILD